MRIVLIITAALFATASYGAAPKRRPPRLHVAVSKDTVPKSVLSHPIPDHGILNEADLVAIAALASSELDQFTQDPSMQYIGRIFTVNLSSYELTTTYSTESSALKVSTSEYTDGFSLDTAIVTSRYTGQNSYGAETTVTKKTGFIYGLANPGASYDHKVIQYSATLGPIEARDLSKALRLRLTGTITAAHGVFARTGSIFFEHAIISDATVSDPNDTFIKKILICSHISKVEWIDSRNGSVVKFYYVSL